MKSFLPLLFVASIFLACEAQVDVPFEKDGVSFTSPAGWKMTEEIVEDESVTITLEKKGFDASGLLTIIWIPDSMDLTYWIRIYQEELQNQIVFKNTEIDFREIKQNSFNGYESVSSSYTFTLLGLKHRGVFQTFHHEDRSFGIIKQEALEDSDANQAGFDKIEQSFVIQ